MPYTEEEIEQLARRAGLKEAFTVFPEDVAAAAQDALLAASELVRPTDPTAEPWPAMRPAEA